MDHLHILWTNGDAVTGELMVMMYAKNAMKNGWWSQVTVIVWGAAVRSLAENEKLQQEMEEAQREGVIFSGCITCAEELGMTEKMKSLGVDLYKWGPPLTELIKSGQPLITV